jgi:hypothetical protein
VLISLSIVCMSGATIGSPAALLDEGIAQPRATTWSGSIRLRLISLCQGAHPWQSPKSVRRLRQEC